MSVQGFNHSVREHPGPSVYSLLFTSFVLLIEFPPFKYQSKSERPLHEEKQTQSKPEPCWKIPSVCCGFFILWMSDERLQRWMKTSFSQSTALRYSWHWIETETWAIGRFVFFFICSAANIYCIWSCDSAVSTNVFVVFFLQKFVLLRKK